MVQLLQANTLEDLRDAILDKLEERRDDYRRQAHASESYRDKTRCHMAATALANIIEDVRGAYIIPRENTQDAKPIQPPEQQIGG